jgi:hypothetical protein
MRAPAGVAPGAFRLGGRLQTRSGLDITQGAAELLWLACEGKQITAERIREVFPGNMLGPEDVLEVWRILGQAGVDVLESASGGSVQPAADAVPGSSLLRKGRIASVENCLQRAGKGKDPQSEAVTAFTARMEEAEREMREVVCSFGFAPHEHITRAERFLTHPSEESFEHVVGDAVIGDRKGYLRVLPGLVKAARALDERAAAAFRKWRRTIGGPGEEGPRHAFQKLEHRLRQILPDFRYRTRVIQEMTAIARNIANQIRSSERVLQQARQSGDSVCRMPLADVEHQAIETLEERVRMPSALYLVKCARLQAAEDKFEQARRELILAHLHLVTEIAGTHTGRGLGLAELIRLGITGLMHAVERFANRHEWSFPAYATCWIQQCIRDAPAARPRPG